MFKVRCPICGGVLTIDDNARKVVEHIRREDAEKEPEERFDSILDNIRRSKAEQDRKLAEMKRRQAERKKRIEELFREAQERAMENDGQ